MTMRKKPTPSTPFTIVGGGGNTVSLPCIGAGPDYTCTLKWALKGNGAIRVEYLNWETGAFLYGNWIYYFAGDITRIYSTTSPTGDLYVPIAWEGKTLDNNSIIYFYSTEVD